MNLMRSYYNNIYSPYKWYFFFQMLQTPLSTFFLFFFLLSNQHNFFLQSTNISIKLFENLLHFISNKFKFSDPSLPRDPHFIHRFCFWEDTSSDPSYILWSEIFSHEGSDLKFFL